MKKVLFALGSRETEIAIADAIKKDFKVVGVATRKGQVIPTVKEVRPDILLLREGLSGTESIKEIVATLRNDYPYVRIIFLANNRNIGDKFLSLLVTYAVYDIVNGTKVNLNDIVSLIYSPNEYKDVAYLQPRIIFDEMGDVNFEMPEVVNIEKKTVVLETKGTAKEDTEKLRKELENELFIKVQSKLREEYNREYNAQLQKRGKLKEEEIKQKLGRMYAEKLEKEKASIHKQVEEELQIKAKKIVEDEKKKMFDKLKLKEDALRKQMDIKIQAALKENRELKNKYESDAYEAQIRKKLEEELRSDVEEERKILEKEMADKFEGQKQEEIKKLKVQMMKEVEVKSKKIIAEKEEEFKAEMEMYKKTVEDEKNKEIDKFRKQLENQEMALKNQLSNTMNQKVKSEVSKITERLKRESEDKEKLLRDEMNAKIDEIVKENKKLKNKYETKAFEDTVRQKLEGELQGKLNQERMKLKEDMDKAIKAKEEELIKEEQLSRKKIEENAKKALAKRQAELEEKMHLEVEKERKRAVKESKAELEKIKSNLIEEKNREIAEYQRETDKKSKEKIRRVEMEKEEEVRRIEMEKEEEVRRIEMEKEEEVKRIKDQLKKEQDDFIKNEKHFTLNNNQQIISFVSGKNGVGTTTVAVNVATQLAMNGSRVLYVELNAETPSVGYWYQLDQKSSGLEGALKSVQTENYRDIEENVLKSRELKKGQFGKFYKSFPNSLDFLIFSKQETLLKSERMSITGEDLKNLYFYLMQHLGYEYIIVDLRIEEEEWITSSILFSTKVYQVLSQDVASIAYLKYRSERIQRNNIPIDRKSEYVVNKFSSKGKLTAKELKKFIGGDVLLVPENHQDVINCIYDGVPTIIGSKDKEFKKAILNIANSIERNK